MGTRTTVVIVDDDAWKRDAMAHRLQHAGEVDVVDVADQDTAAGWDRDRWRDLDVVLVDVYDDRAPGEVGTDLYSGIRVVERVADMPVRCVAVTPTCAHPLVQLRLHQARPDYVYHRWHVSSLDALTEAIRFPSAERRLQPPDPDVLRRLGARRLRANEIVRHYETSTLAGRLQAHSGHKELAAHGVTRGDLERMKRHVVECGYAHAEVADVERGLLAGERGIDPRWPDIRLVVLMLLGRLDAPPSEFDRPWWGL